VNFTQVEILVTRDTETRVLERATVAGRCGEIDESKPFWPRRVQFSQARP
jgi:hypothetical protein